jgi:hypothetical protein
MYSHPFSLGLYPKSGSIRVEGECSLALVVSDVGKMFDSEVIQGK